MSERTGATGKLHRSFAFAQDDMGELLASAAMNMCRLQSSGSVNSWQNGGYSFRVTLKFFTERVAEEFLFGADANH